MPEGRRGLVVWLLGRGRGEGGGLGDVSNERQAVCNDPNFLFLVLCWLQARLRIPGERVAILVIGDRTTAPPVALSPSHALPAATGAGTAGELLREGQGRQ
jgi:hypothetical protein